MSFFPSFCLEKLFPGWILCFFSFSLSLFRPFPSLVYPICLYHRALSYIVRSLAPFIIKIILIKIIILKNNSCNNNQSRRVRIHGCANMRVCACVLWKREGERKRRRRKMSMKFWQALYAKFGVALHLYFLFIFHLFSPPLYCHLLCRHDIVLGMEQTLILLDNSSQALLKLIYIVRRRCVDDCSTMYFALLCFLLVEFLKPKIYFYNQQTDTRHNPHRIFK